MSEPRSSGEFEQLVRAHEAALRRFCHRLAGRTDGDDLMQETLTRAMVSFGGLRDSDRFLPWCRQIARNANARRARGTRPTEPLVDTAASGDLQTEVVEELVRRSELAQVLGAMPERSRHVLTARAEGVPPATLAAAFGVSRTLVDTWFARSRTQARALLLAVREDGYLGTLGLAMRPLVAHLAPHRNGRRAAVAALVAGVGVTTILLTAPPIRPGRSATGSPSGVSAAAAEAHSQADGAGRISPSLVIATLRQGRLGLSYATSLARTHPLALPTGLPRLPVAATGALQPITIGPLLPDQQLLIGLDPCAFLGDVGVPCPPLVARMRVRLPLWR